MADSLRDQLVKAGLATASQAKKAERQVHKKSVAAPQENTRKRADDLNTGKARRNREIARAVNEKAAGKALRAEIKQIILQNDQRQKQTNEDDVAYNFVHGQKIKRIYVPPAQRDQLSAGSLVIVNNDGLYHLVSKAVAEKIRSRDPKRIIAAHADKPPEPGSDDEFYAKFEVPDDLDW